MVPPSDIDAVYTWVDGSRSDYIDLVRLYAPAARDLNPERFRDSFDLLRYSLRSLEVHAPWIRRVYLLTCRPQVPDWLCTDHPKLRVVHHDEVCSEPGVLPVFNSNVIETFLDRLPEISEQFIYFNDDYFLGSPVSKSDFYSADGRIRICGTLLGERMLSRVHEHQMLSFGLLEHAPRLIDKGIWAGMKAAYPGYFAEPAKHRFRSPGDVRPERFYNWYALSHARDRVSVEPFWRFLRYSSFLKITNRYSVQKKSLERLCRDRPKFFCLNDDQRGSPNPDVIRLVRSALAAMYPLPSSYERAP
jgi:hypothetical protein